MESIAAFLDIFEAIRFCDTDKRESLFVQRELDGRYHVYDGDQPDEREQELIKSIKDKIESVIR